MEVPPEDAAARCRASEHPSPATTISRARRSRRSASEEIHHSCSSLSPGIAVRDETEPASAKPGTPQADHHVWTVAHQTPDQPGSVVLDHQQDRSLIDGVVHTRDPCGLLALGDSERGVQAPLVPVFPSDPGKLLRAVAERGKNDLWRERERRSHRPRRERAIIRAERRAPRPVVVEAPPHAANQTARGSGAVARRKPPRVRPYPTNRRGLRMAYSRCTYVAR